MVFKVPRLHLRHVIPWERIENLPALYPGFAETREISLLSIHTAGCESIALRGTMLIIRDQLVQYIHHDLVADRFANGHDIAGILAAVSRHGYVLSRVDKVHPDLWYRETGFLSESEWLRLVEHVDLHLPGGRTQLLWHRRDLPAPPMPPVDAVVHATPAL